MPSISLCVSLVVAVSMVTWLLNLALLMRRLEFVNEIVGGAIPREYIPAIHKGIEEQMKNGVIAGYPLLGLKPVCMTVPSTTLTQRNGL